MSNYIENDITISLSDIDATITGSVVPYQKAVMYLKNGDPGYPAEGGYCEDVTVSIKRSVRIKESDGKFVTHEIDIDITDLIDKDELVDISSELYDTACQNMKEEYECAMERKYEEREEERRMGN